jgi:hypothetical protein
MNEDLIQTILREAPSRILTGLSPEDATSVEAAFERLVRVAIGKADPTFFPNFEILTLGVGDDLIKAVAEVPPENRLAYIEQELLDREISDLDRSAWDIAELSLQDLPDLPALQAQAKTILDNILEKQQLLEEKGPEWQMRYARNLSEATLDCNFVLGDHSRSSLRLGRTIRFLQEEGRWPPSQP